MQDSIQNAFLSFQYRCPNCYIQTRKLSEDTFKEYVESRGDTLIGEYTDSRSEIEIKCGKCDVTFATLSNSYRQGCGCPPCSIIGRRLPYEEVKKRIEDFGDMLLSTEYINISTPLQIKCGICDRIFEKVLSTPHCPSCNATTLEKYVFAYLNNNDIEFTTQKTYTDLRSSIGKVYKYDFFIPSSNLIIEVDGKQHMVHIPFFGDIDHFNKIKERDVTKTKYCIDKDIKLIRVSYKELTSHENTKFVLDRLLEEVKTNKFVVSNTEVYADLLAALV